MGEIQDDIENKAEEVKASGDQHLGDAMDDADLEAADSKTGDGELEADGLATGAGPAESGDEHHQNQGDGTGQDGSGSALDDLDLEPPSS